MLLAVDIGNTNIKFGIFEGDRLRSKSSIPTDDGLSSIAIRSQMSGASISNAVVCSVVPEKNKPLTDILRQAFGIDPVMITNDVDVGMKIDYEPLASLGTDRLVNSFAAVEKYRAPCIVCSIGTATTIDVVTSDHVLRGGVIAPGMKMMASALHTNTAKLPEISVGKPVKLLGNTTAESIRSGIFNGQVAIINGLVHTIKKDVESGTKVIATGGYAPLIAQHTSIIDILDEDLLLDGLRLIHDRVQRG
jgi:type III pantothenate kinase